MRLRLPSFCPLFSRTKLLCTFKRPRRSGHLWGGLPLDLRVKTHIEMHVDVIEKSFYILFNFQKRTNRVDRLKIRRRAVILTVNSHGLVRPIFCLKMAFSHRPFANFRDLEFFKI